MTSSTTLLVVDVQNNSCHPHGVTAHLVGPLNDIESVIDNLALGKSAAAYPITAALRANDGAVRGTWDDAIVDELTPRGVEIVIDKTRLDSFLYTPPELILHNLGIDSLIVGGCATNFGVETTVMSASQRDFDVTVLDATATYGHDMQQRSLTAIAACCFAAVKPWREVFLSGNDQSDLRYGPVLTNSISRIEGEA